MMRTFNLNMSEQDIETIGAALVEFPYRAAAPVIDRINAQLKDIQDRAREEDAAINAAAPKAAPPVS